MISVNKVLPCQCRNDKRVGYNLQAQGLKERFRPVPLFSPILLPTAHALVWSTLSYIFIFSPVPLMMHAWKTLWIGSVAIIIVFNFEIYNTWQQIPMKFEVKRS